MCVETFENVPENVLKCAGPLQVKPVITQERVFVNPQIYQKFLPGISTRL